MSRYFMSRSPLVRGGRGGRRASRVSLGRIRRARLDTRPDHSPAGPVPGAGAGSSGADLAGAPVAAAQRALHVALEVDRGVLAGEVQAAVPAGLDAVERGVLAHLEVGVGAADVRISR